MSKVGTISVDKLLSAIDLTMEDYAKGVDKCLATASKEAGDYGADKLRHVSPKRTGNYRNSWTYGAKQIKKGKSYRSEMVIYNQKYYRLTHLLEKSHRIANKYGSYGMSKAQPHISTVQKQTEREFLEIFERELGKIRL